MKAIFHRNRSEKSPRESIDDVRERLSSFSERKRAELRALQNFVEPEIVGGPILSEKRTKKQALGLKRIDKIASGRPSPSTIVYEVTAGNTPSLPSSTSPTARAGKGLHFSRSVAISQSGGPLWKELDDLNSGKRALSTGKYKKVNALSEANPSVESDEAEVKFLSAALLRKAAAGVCSERPNRNQISYAVSVLSLRQQLETAFRYSLLTKAVPDQDKKIAAFKLALLKVVPPGKVVPPARDSFDPTEEALRQVFGTFVGVAALGCDPLATGSKPITGELPRCSVAPGSNVNEDGVEVADYFSYGTYALQVKFDAPARDLVSIGGKRPQELLVLPAPKSRTR